MGYIYKIINSQTPSVYVGKTEGTIEKRWKEHIRKAQSGDKTHLYNAIRLYGEDCFQIKQIEECDNSLLNDREIYWINYYDSYNNGYNMTIGGDGRTKYNYKEIADKYLELKSEKQVAEFFGCSKRVIQWACESQGIKIKKGLNEEYWNSEKGQLHREQMRQLGLASRGRVVSEETRKKQSEAKKGKYVGEKNPMYGRKFSEEHRRKMSENSARAKKVQCIETGEIFSSGLQAAKKLKMKSSSGISACCRGARKTSGGFHWRFVKEGENNF